MHDVNNKECPQNKLDPLCYPMGTKPPALHVDIDASGSQWVCPYSVCTCNALVEEWEKEAAKTAVEAHKLTGSYSKFSQRIYDGFRSTLLSARTEVLNLICDDCKKKVQ